MQKFLRFLMLTVLFLPFALQAQNTLTFDFEDNAVPATWTNSTNYPWVVTSTSQGNGHSGTYCLMSGNTGVSSSTSTISATFTFAGDGSISFLGGIYGEGTSSVWDECIFTIDGVEQFSYGALQTWTTYTYTLEAGVHTFTWSYTKDGSVNPTGDAFYIDNVVVDLGVATSCSRPTAVTPSAVTDNTIDITWTPLGDESAWKVYLYENDNLVAGYPVDAYDTTYTLTNLTANTLYKIGVKANCSGELSAERYINARTACEALTTFPWNEDFENIAANSSYSYNTLYALSEPCWVNEHISGSGTYLFEVSTYNTTGNTTHQLRLPDMTSGTMTKLVLPPMDIPTDANYMFSLDVYRNTSTTNYEEGIRVYVSTTGNIEGATELAFISRSYTTGNAVIPAEEASGWYTYELPLGISGTCYIIIRGESRYGAPTYMDNFAVTEAPSCIQVSALTVTSTTSNSITLSWADDFNTDASYIVYNMSDTTEIYDADIVGTTAVISDLNANTTYTFGVVADCGDEMAAIRTVSGRTACATENFPWSENFDSWTTKSECWSFMSGALSTTPNLTSNTSAWTLSSTYGDYITIDGKALAMNLYSSNKYWAITPPIDITSDDAALGVDVAVAAWSASAPNYDNNDTLAFLISTDGGNTFTILQVLDGTQLNNLENTYTTIWTPVTNYSGQEARFAIYGGSISGTSPYDNRIAIDNVFVGETPTCMPVTNLNIDSITSNSLYLSWADDDNTDATYIIYDMSDTTEIYDAYIDGTTAVISDLNANTSYTFGVAADCGGDLATIRTITGRTACAAMALPITTSFEAADLQGTTSALLFPHCWTRINTLTSGYYYYPYAYNYGSVHTGQRSLYFYAYSTDYADTTGFVMPELDVTTYPMNANRVTFWGKVSSTTDYKVLVGTMTDPDNMSTFTLIDTVTVTGTTFTKYAVSLANADPTDAYVAFLVPRVYSTMYIDDVTLEEEPSCPDVEGLTIDSQTASTVNISWNDNGATEYEVEVRQNNVVVTTATVSVIDTTAEISDLVLDNDYQVVVRAICSTGNGAWTLPLNIHIGYCLPNPTSVDNNGITNVSFGGMTNTTHPTSAPYYGNYYTMSGTVPAGLPTTVNITYATGYTYTTIIWVDWNNNLVFDADEIVYTGESASTNPTTLSATFNIPATTAIGSYRMRIAGADSYFDSYTPDPCFSSTYSIAEDYTLIVDDAPSCLPVTNLVVDSVTDSSVFLSWNDEDNIGATYTIYDMADTSIVAEYVSGYDYEVSGLDATTNYTFGVVANCSAGDESFFVTVSATTECAAGNCLITIVGEDSFGDGWNGNTINVIQSGITIGTFTISTGSSYTETYSVCSDAPVSFSWVTGSYAYETSFNILDGGDEVVYSVADGSTLSTGTFFTMTNACPTCTKPTVAVDAFDENSVTISWTGNAGSYDVYNGTTFVDNVSGNTYTFTDLVTDSNYVFGVQGICSVEDSSNIATVNAITGGCTEEITTLPHYESFENGLGCWMTINNSSDGMPWYTYNCAGLTDIEPHHGTYVASSWSWNNVAMHADAWLISPKIVLPNTSDSLHFSWWEITNASYPDHYSVSISTTTNGPSAFTHVARPNSIASSTWTMQTIDLTPYAGQEIYIGFHHVDYDANYLLIDDIALYEGAYTPPAPPTPDTLNVTFAVNNISMGTTDPVPGTYQYISGDTVRFHATPNAGYRFVQWEYTLGTSTEVQTFGSISAYFTANAFMQYENVSFTAVFEAGNPDSTTITYAVNDPTMGTTTPAPGTYTIYVGNNIEASATANTGYELSAWVYDIYVNGVLYSSDTTFSDDADFNNPMNFGILSQAFPDNDATITITAIFESGSTPVTQYNVTVTSANTNMGSVSSTHSGQVAENTEVTVTATAANGYHFVAWMSGTTQVSTANPFTFTVTSDITLTATFEANDPAVTYYNVTVNSANTNMGNVSSTHSGQVAENTAVTVTATAANGYHFVAWMSGTTQVSTANPFTFTVTSDTTLTATFEANPVTTYTVTLNTSDATMGTVSPAGAQTVNEGSSFTATATAADGYEFVNWVDGNGNVVSTENPYTFTITGDITLTATFQPTVGISDIDASNILIYATSNTIIVRGAEGNDINVFDMSGRCIFQQTNANETERIAMSSTGIYLVKLSNGIVKKVVVVK